MWYEIFLKKSIWKKIMLVLKPGGERVHLTRRYKCTWVRSQPADTPWLDKKGNRPRFSEKKAAHRSRVDRKNLTQMTIIFVVQQRPENCLCQKNNQVAIIQVQTAFLERTITIAPPRCEPNGAKSEPQVKGCRQLHCAQRRSKCTSATTQEEGIWAICQWINYSFTLFLDSCLTFISLWIQYYHLFTARQK